MPNTGKEILAKDTKCVKNSSISINTYMFIYYNNIQKGSAMTKPPDIPGVYHI
jgi:hypothetical protein